MIPDPQAHLLVVDDDERIRGLLQKFLMRSGFLVTIARDATQPKELLLRINAILRRVPQVQAEAGPKMLHMGDVRYDLERGELWRGTDPVRLTATEAQLMRVFAAQAGEPVSRETLAGDLDRAEGLDEKTGQERAVDVQITRLRRKIETDPKQPRYLQTVRGAGYMLAPD